MKRLLFEIVCCFFLLVFVNSSYAQTIVAKKKFLGMEYSQNNQHLNSMTLNQILLAQPASAKVIGDTYMTYKGGKIVAIIGGVVIGWQLAKKLNNNYTVKTNNHVIGLGFAIEAVSLGMIYRFVSRAKKAVDVYNLNCKKDLGLVNDIKIISTNRGIGFSLNF